MTKKVVSILDYMTDRFKAREVLKRVLDYPVPEHWHPADAIIDGLFQNGYKIVPREDFDHGE